MHATRTVLDVIVQSSTVELFQFWDVAVAPGRRVDVQSNTYTFTEMVGVVTFHAPRFTGTLTLSLDPNLLTTLPRVPAEARRRRDWLREMVNQLVGRIKNRLINFQVTLRIGLPTAMNGLALDAKHQKFEKLSVYVFRTLRGEVTVTLSGDIDPDALVYSGANLPTEGELIEF